MNDQSPRSLRITFCTGVGTVTGANFLLEAPSAAAGSAGSKILVDCGMVQGEKVAMAENAETFPYDLASIQALVITHAHLDHVGRIPKLVKDGYKGPIYSTPETRELAELVLTDAVNIIAGEARQHGTVPLYGSADVEAVFPLWKTLPYHQSLKIADGISIFLKDAGHILGSAMVEVSVSPQGRGHVEGDLADASAGRSGDAETSTKILFTGDLGNSPAPLLCDTEPVGDADYIVMESCYGDRNHEDRDDRSAKLERVVKESIARGGTLIIPTFAIDRTQIILYELNDLVEQKKIASVPVYVDSPMAIKATEIYKQSEQLFNAPIKEQIRQGDDIFSFKHLEYTMSRSESADIERMKGAKIVLAGSGMSAGGRIVSHEAEYLPDARNTLLLVGYQGPGSLGRQLADGAKKVVINGQTIPVNAHVETLYGFSAHKDSDHLVQFVATGTDRLKEVFAVMGEPKASMHLAQRLNDELRVKAIVPDRLKTYELE